MTNVVLLKSGKDIRGFEVHGHSGYAEAGSDIVCSAVSALTQTAAMGLEELLRLELELSSAEGELSCLLPREMDAKIRPQAQLILETMALGIRAMTQTYGKYIKLTERKVSNDDEV